MKLISLAAAVLCMSALSARAKEVPADIAAAYDHPRIADTATARTLVGSPDGTHVIYSLYSSSNPSEAQVGFFTANGSPQTSLGMTLWMVDLASKAARQICAGDGANWDPSFSPDGKRVAFYSDRGGEARLWILDLASNACRMVSPVHVKAMPFPNEQPHWSPDSASVYIPIWPGSGGGSFAEATRKFVPGLPPTPDANGVTILRNTPDETSAAAAAAPSDNDLDARCGQFTYMASSLARVNLADGSVTTLVGDEQQSAVARGADRHHPSAWLKLSSSGRWLSYYSAICARPGRPLDDAVDLYVVPAAGGIPLRVANGLRAPLGGQEFGMVYRWNPRSDQLLFVKDGALFKVEMGANGPLPPQRLASKLGHLVPGLLRYSPDGSAAYVGIDEQHWHDLMLQDAMPVIARVPLDGSSPVRIATRSGIRINELPGDASDDAFTSDHGLIARGIDTGSGKSMILGLDFDHRRASILFDQSARIDATIFANGKPVAIYQDFATPPDLYAFSGDWHDRVQLSHVAPALSQLHAGPIESFQTVIPFHDGTLQTVRSVLLLPPGARPGDALPTIVWFYPGSDYGQQLDRYGAAMLDDPAQVFTNRGYAVLLTNIPLGPGGQKGNVLDEITDELLPQVYHAVDLGYVDPHRLALRGQSFGGYATAAIISRTNLFHAAVASAGVYDLGGAYGQAYFIEGQLVDNSFWMEKSQPRLGASLWDDPMRYIVNSPYYRADEIHTPLLILQGTSDPVGFSEGPKLFAALRRLNRSVELALYDGGGHEPAGWRAPQAQDQALRTLAFLDDHLKGDRTTTTRPIE